MTPQSISGWQFCDEHGTFELANPCDSSYLYFPLMNESGLVSVVTPTLHGDIKTNQNTFLTLPVSVEDLHASRSTRNFWVSVKGRGAWSVAGNSAPQIAQRTAEEVMLRAGFLWHTVERTNSTLGLRASHQLRASQQASGRIDAHHVDERRRSHADHHADCRHSDLWPFG
jgi:hypothetical protein